MSVGHRFRKCTPIAIAAGVVLLVTACGSASTSAGQSGSSTTVGSSSATQGSAVPAVAAAKAEFAKYSAAQPDIAVPALAGKPATGKTITILTCPNPVCTQETDAAAAAAKLLGWKVTALSSAQTPEAYQGALTQIVANPTDFVAITPSTPDSFISGQLTALQKAGSKVIEMSPSGSTPSAQGLVQAAVAGIPLFTFSGRLMGDAIVKDAGGAADTVFVWDPSIATVIGSVKSGMTDVVTASGGSVGVLDISFADIGKTIPGQVVSYVQSHPKVKYIAFAVADAATGVPQALAAAGLSQQVKLISRAPSAGTMADIKSGAQWASVGEENAAGGYRAVDLFARMASNVALGDLRDTAGWHQIFTHSNLPTVAGAPTAPGSPQAFLTAWHLS